MKAFIKRMRNPTTNAMPDHYMLVDEHGVPFDHQIRTELVSQPDDLPTFTVTFVAGEMGLQVVDERDDKDSEPTP